MSFEQGSVCFLVVTETKDIIGKCSLLDEKVSSTFGTSFVVLCCLLICLFNFIYFFCMKLPTVCIIALSVFGTLVGVYIQTHIVLLFVLLFMLAEAVGQPFDSTSGDYDRLGTPRLRYKTLHQLEITSLFVTWLTLW